MSSRELSPMTQAAAVCCLWMGWGLVAWYVPHRQQILRAGQQYYDNPALIYSLLVLWMPLPIVVAGVMFLRRCDQRQETREQIAYWAVALSTLLGFVVLLVGVALSMLLEGSIRE